MPTLPIVVRPCMNVETLTGLSLFVSSLVSILVAGARGFRDRVGASCGVSLLLCLRIGLESLSSQHGGETVHLIIFSSLISCKGLLYHVVHWPCSGGTVCSCEAYLPLGAAFLLTTLSLVPALLPLRTTAEYRLSFTYHCACD